MDGCVDNKFAKFKFKDMTLVDIRTIIAFGLNMLLVWKVNPFTLDLFLKIKVEY
jgi:hypothetical protein